MGRASSVSAASGGPDRSPLRGRDPHLQRTGRVLVRHGLRHQPAHVVFRQDLRYGQYPSVFRDGGLVVFYPGTLLATVRGGGPQRPVRRADSSRFSRGHYWPVSFVVRKDVPSRQDAFFSGNPAGSRPLRSLGGFPVPCLWGFLRVGLFGFPRFRHAVPGHAGCRGTVVVLPAGPFGRNLPLDRPFGQIPERHDLRKRDGGFGKPPVFPPLVDFRVPILHLYGNPCSRVAPFGVSAAGRTDWLEPGPHAEGGSRPLWRLGPGQPAGFRRGGVCLAVLLPRPSRLVLCQPDPECHDGPVRYGNRDRLAGLPRRGPGQVAPCGGRHSDDDCRLFLLPAAPTGHVQRAGLGEAVCGLVPTGGIRVPVCGTRLSPWRFFLRPASRAGIESQGRCYRAWPVAGQRTEICHPLASDV